MVDNLGSVGKCGRDVVVNVCLFFLCLKYLLSGVGVEEPGCDIIVVCGLDLVTELPLTCKGVKFNRCCDFSTSDASQSNVCLDIVSQICRFNHRNSNKQVVLICSSVIEEYRSLVCKHRLRLVGIGVRLISHKTQTNSENRMKHI